MGKATFVQFSCGVCRVKSEVYGEDDSDVKGCCPPGWAYTGDHILVCGVCLGKVRLTAEKALAEAAKMLVTQTCDITLAYGVFKRALDAAWWKMIGPTKVTVTKEDLPK